MIASEGFSIFGSGRSSTRMSPGAWRTAPRMVVPLGRVRRAGGQRRHGGSVAPEDLLGDGDRGEGLRPACIEGQVRDELDELLLGDAVVLRVLQMEGQLLGVAPGQQRGDGDEAAVALRQLRALPDLAEE